MTTPILKAPFYRRFLAGLIDAVIVQVFVWILYLATLLYWPKAATVMGALMGLSFLIYGVLFEGVFWKGQTLGKRFLKIRVVMPDGGPVTLGRAVLRHAIIGMVFLVSPATFFFPNEGAGRYLFMAVLGLCYGIMFWQALCNLSLIVFQFPKKILWHDVISQSFVSMADVSQGEKPILSGRFKIFMGFLGLLSIIFGLAFGALFSRVPFKYSNPLKMHPWCEVLEKNENHQNVFCHYVEPSQQGMPHFLSVRIQLDKFPDDPKQYAINLYTQLAPQIQNDSSEVTMMIQIGTAFSMVAGPFASENYTLTIQPDGSFLEMPKFKDFIK